MFYKTFSIKWDFGDSSVWCAITSSFRFRWWESGWDGKHGQWIDRDIRFYAIHYKWYRTGLWWWVQAHSSLLISVSDLSFSSDRVASFREDCKLNFSFLNLFSLQMLCKGWQRSSECMAMSWMNRSVNDHLMRCYTWPPGVSANTVTCTSTSCFFYTFIYIINSWFQKSADNINNKNVSS